jgi:hypothetical protein
MHDQYKYTYFWRAGGLPPALSFYFSITKLKLIIYFWKNHNGLPFQHSADNRQLENKPLADYVKRFKGNQDSMAQNMGKNFLKDFMKNTKQYVDETDIDKQDEMQK